MYTAYLKFLKYIFFKTSHPINIYFTLSLFRYSHGPVPLQSQHYSTSQDIINSISCIREEMSCYKPCLTQVYLVGVGGLVAGRTFFVCLFFWGGLA